MKRRLFFWTVGSSIGAFFVLLCSLILPAGSWLAVLLLDKQVISQGALPYPLTFQNLMIILFFFTLGELLNRALETKAEMTALKRQILPQDDRSVLTYRELPEIRKKLRFEASGHPKLYLERLVNQCILHFQSNRSVQGTHQLLSSMNDLELHQIELDYTISRYMTWLLPTIGFIGTVVGIAQALTRFAELVEAGKKMKEILPSVTANLGMAFNTTIVALFMSVILVLLMQLIQQQEEESVNQSATYCLCNLINRLYEPKHSSDRGAS